MQFPEGIFNKDYKPVSKKIKQSVNLDFTNICSTSKICVTSRRGMLLQLALTGRAVDDFIQNCRDVAAALITKNSSNHCGKKWVIAMILVSPMFTFNGPCGKTFFNCGKKWVIVTNAMMINGSGFNSE